MAADSSAFVKYDNKTEPVLLRGFIFDQADSIYHLKDSITEGNLPTKDSEVILGAELRDKLGVKMGDTIELQNISGGTLKLIVCGFYDLKVSAINKSWLMVDLATAQNFFDFGSSVTSIETQVAENEVFNADVIAANIQNVLQDDTLKVDNWKEQNQQLLSGLNGQSVSSYLIQVFVIVSVVLGISSVLSITVLQKSRQIGILKAMGLKDGQTRLVFLFEGLILGVFGAVVGILLGAGLLFAFTTFALNPDGTPVVPIYWNYWFIALSGVIAIVACLVASVIPAGKSSKLSPIEVIRNG